MNHLAHFFLASPNPGLMVGGFLGDFVKGPMKGNYAQDLEQGISLHRAIDVFTDQHPIVKQSQRRFEKPYRRFSPIICDIVFDHFLALDWHQYSNASLVGFSQQAYQMVIERKLEVPGNALKSIERMQSYGALESYQSQAFIDNALRSLSKRFSRKNPLAQGFDQYLIHKQGLHDDFVQFMPEVIGFAACWMTQKHDQTDGN